MKKMDEEARIWGREEGKWEEDMEGEGQGGKEKKGNGGANTVGGGDIVSWEREGRYCSAKMFRWEPEGCYRCTKSMAKAPFWFSTEHLWTAITPSLALNWRYMKRGKEENI